MNNPLIVTLRFLILLFVQIFLCNHIHFFGFINPYIYIMAILLMPLTLSRYVQYLIAFSAGLVVDAFFMTYGVHASACLLVAFARPYLIDLLDSSRTIDDNTLLPMPEIKSFGWLFGYTFILSFLHHLCTALLERFSFHSFVLTFIFSILNAIFTTAVILCVEYILFSRKKYRKSRSK
ncbi:MAG: rod shape-determining protein MreD [Bacteroidales bacterium]|jgi:hypothetical protein|nr:rod shape-determining protein MreD [Bacteroidales bacterium]